jgi:hypothetical protein
MVATTLATSTLPDAAATPPAVQAPPRRYGELPGHESNPVAGLMLASLLSLPLWGLVVVVVRLAVA